jgi:hypothetical protein
MTKFYCPICRVIEERSEVEPTCKQCGKTMLAIEEDFTNLLKGKKIVMVAYAPDWRYKIEKRFKKDEADLEYDGNEIYLILDDGNLIRAWNSEWGGIEYIKKYKGRWKLEDDA